MPESSIKKPGAAQKSAARAALANTARGASAKLPVAVHIKFSLDDLPVTEPLTGDRFLYVHTAVTSRHENVVSHVVAVPETGLMATVCGGDNGLRVFALNGGDDDDPLRTCANNFPRYSRAMCALGGDVVACAVSGGKISTWRASSGELLETLHLLSNGGEAVVMAAVGIGGFVVGTKFGALVFVAHTGGRVLREVARPNSKHSAKIHDVAVHGDRIVTASADGTAAVWSAATHERMALLRGHHISVRCVDISVGYIATGSEDGIIRIFENDGGSFSLIRKLEGLHLDVVYTVSLINGTLLMSASWDESWAFTSISNGTLLEYHQVHRGKVPPMLPESATVLPDGQVAFVGLYCYAMVQSPPAQVAEEMKKHASALFHPAQPSSLTGNDPLQAAAVIDLTNDLPSASGAAQAVAGKASGSVPKDGVAAGSSSDGKTPCSDSVDVGPTAPPADVRAAGSSFDLKSLKATASSAKDVESMTCEELSIVVAAAMTNFDEACRPHLPVLSKSLGKLFGARGISGYCFIGFPHAALLEIILKALKEDNLYQSLGKDASRIFEWHLRQFLLYLRGSTMAHPAGQ